MQKIKKSTSPSVFSTYFQPINHVYQTRFSKINFEQPDAFSKYVKFTISYQNQKLWNNYPITLENNIASIIFFKRRIKEKLLSNESELNYY